MCTSISSSDFCARGVHVGLSCGGVLSFGASTDLCDCGVAVGLVFRLRGVLSFGTS